MILPAGLSYHLTRFYSTYPTTYGFNFAYTAYADTLLKDASGGMFCSKIVNSCNDAFAIPQLANETRLSGTAIDAERAFVSSAFPGCRAGGSYGTQFAHVAVSVLTVSSSTRIGQATPAPSPVPVAQSPTIPVTEPAP